MDIVGGGGGGGGTEKSVKKCDYDCVCPSPLSLATDVDLPLISNILFVRCTTV